ncbi:MAG TPA: START domain-containing protein [Polyangia bacterium]
MRSLLFTALLLAVATPARADDGAWERVSDKDGIVVQRRSVDGSKLKEFRGRGVVRAPIGRVLAVIRDADRRAEWMPSCGDSHLVAENVAARTQIAYHRTKAPWPVSDRDSINRAEMIVEPDKHRVYMPFEAIPFTAIPPVKGVVRMPSMRGHWILIPVDGGRATDAEYQVFADPGGSLPDWLANLASKTLPRDTIAGLRKQAARVDYPAFESQVAAAPETAALLR